MNFLMTPSHVTRFKHMRVCLTNVKFVRHCRVKYVLEIARGRFCETREFNDSSLKGSPLYQ